MGVFKSLSVLGPNRLEGGRRRDSLSLLGLVGKLFVHKCVAAIFAFAPASLPSSPPSPICVICDGSFEKCSCDWGLGAREVWVFLSAVTPSLQVLGNRMQNGNEIHRGIWARLCLPGGYVL